MTQKEKQKIRIGWHVRLVNIAQEVTDYSKVEALIVDYCLQILDKAIKDKLEAVEGEIKALEVYTSNDYIMIGDINCEKLGEFLEKDLVLEIINKHK